MRRVTTRLVGIGGVFSVCAQTIELQCIGMWKLIWAFSDVRLPSYREGEATRLSDFTAHCSPSDLTKVTIPLSLPSIRMPLTWIQGYS